MTGASTERQIPLLLAAAGIVLYAVAAVTHAGAGGVPLVLFAVLVGAIIQTVLLIAAAFLASAVLNIGFGDLNAAVLKFAGITLFSGAIAALFPLGGLIGSVLFLVLLLWLFDLEWQYAFALGIAYYVVSLLAAVIIRGLFG